MSKPKTGPDYRVAHKPTDANRQTVPLHLSLLPATPTNLPEVGRFILFFSIKGVTSPLVGWYGNGYIFYAVVISGVSKLVKCPFTSISHWIYLADVQENLERTLAVTSLSEVLPE